MDAGLVMAMLAACDPPYGEPGPRSRAGDDRLARVRPGPMDARRNDPCQCGSGRKYKRCCGQQGRSNEAT